MPSLVISSAVTCFSWVERGIHEEMGIPVTWSGTLIAFPELPELQHDHYDIMEAERRYSTTIDGEHFDRSAQNGFILGVTSEPAAAGDMPGEGVWFYQVRPARRKLVVDRTRRGVFRQRW
jgi:hypothetical protein